MAPNELEAELRHDLSATDKEERHHRSLEEIARVIDRHTAAWRLGSGVCEEIDPGARPARIPDKRTTPSDRDLMPPPLPHLERIPFLTRLQRLKQLSTVSVTTHFGATHTRFSHAVGSVFIASLMLDRIREQGRSGGTIETDSLVARGLGELEGDPEWGTACLIYCAIHDAFHGPFGHSLDIMKDVFGGSPTEKLDDFYLRRALEAALEGTADPVGDQLRAAAALWIGSNEKVDELLRKLQLLTSPRQLLSVAPHLYFLRQIVDSQIDADRIDYVLRDAHYLEAKDYRDDILPLTSCIRLVELSPPPKKEGDPKPPPRVSLSFERASAGAAAKLLGLRRRYYTEYYEASSKLVVDDMICHGVAHVLDELGVRDSSTIPAEIPLLLQVKRGLMMLTDEDFVDVLLELQAPRPEAYDLLLRYQQRRFFQPVSSMGIALAQFPRVNTAAVTWINAVEQYLDDVAKEAGVDWAVQAPDRFSPETPRDALGRLLREALGGDGDEELRLRVLSFGFQFWTQSVFRKRQRFERIVWDRLTTGPLDKDMLAVILKEEFGDATNASFSRVDAWPPLHVTTSSSFPLRDRSSLVLHQKEGFFENVLFHSAEDPSVAHENPIVPEVDDELEAYPLVLSTWPSIVKHLGEASLIDAFKGVLWELDWLVEQKLPGDGLSGAPGRA